MKKELPYITISDPSLNLLIDTGSTKSFLTPDFCAKIPSFPELNSEYSLNFYLFKFHQTFDGLIGLDNLKLLQAKLDYPNSKLITKNSILLIHYYETNKTQFYSIQLEPHTVTRVKLPVKENNGTIILSKQNIWDAILHETLTNVHNELAWAELFNNNDNEIRISLTEPIHSKNFNPEEYFLFNFEITSQNSEKHDIEHLIRTDHLNAEEKYHIMKLCKKY